MKGVAQRSCTLAHIVKRAQQFNSCIALSNWKAMLWGAMATRYALAIGGDVRRRNSRQW